MGSMCPSIWTMMESWHCVRFRFLDSQVSSPQEKDAESKNTFCRTLSPWKPMRPQKMCLLHCNMIVPKLGYCSSLQNSTLIFSTADLCSWILLTFAAWESPEESYISLHKTFFCDNAVLFGWQDSWESFFGDKHFCFVSEKYSTTPSLPSCARKCQETSCIRFAFCENLFDDNCLLEPNMTRAG